MTFCFLSFKKGLHKMLYSVGKANTVAMSRRDVIPGNVTFHQAEESDFQGMVRLCEDQGWDTEDHHRLASIQPSAVHIAKCGTKIVGLCFYII